jgi:DNA invertase Pin-like site-specific DNA recombinase
LLTPTTWPRPVRGLLLSSVSIKAGLKRAVAQGVKLGRQKIDSAMERKVRRQLAKGVGILKVAKSLGIGTGTVQRISKELG